MPQRPALVATTLAMLTALGAGAVAEPPREKLLEALATAIGEPPTGAVQFGELKDADETEFTVNVDPGMTYHVFGVCDANCTQLSLAAKDSKGELIDITNRKAPKVDIDKFEGATISITVMMMNCQSEPCGFALALEKGLPKRRSKSSE